MYNTGKFGSCSHNNSFFPPSLSRAGLGGGNKGGGERGNERETCCGKAVVSCVCVGKDCDWVLYTWWEVCTEKEGRRNIASDGS